MSLEAKHKALKHLAAAYLTFKEATLHIPDQKATAAMHGDWSAKDLIAHISSWDELTSMDIHRVVRGHMPVLAAFKRGDIDEWNAFMMRGRRHFPHEQVDAELEGCYEMLLEAVEAAPEAMFGQGSLVENFLGIANRHYREHAGHIREWREREGI